MQNVFDDLRIPVVPPITEICLGCKALKGLMLLISVSFLVCFTCPSSKSSVYDTLFGVLLKVWQYAYYV